jgi:hypothetical protein
MSMLISGLACLRTTPGKIEMLRGGLLTPRRAVKYALEGSPVLQAAAEHYILSNPALHSSVVAFLTPYLNCEKYFVQSSRLLAGSEHDGDPMMAGNARQWPVYEEVRIYPERKIAQRLLRVIQEKSTDGQFKSVIQALLDKAPSNIVTTTG